MELSVSYVYVPLYHSYRGFQGFEQNDSSYVYTQLQPPSTDAYLHDARKRAVSFLGNGMQLKQKTKCLQFNGAICSKGQRYKFIWSRSTGKVINTR